MYKLQFLFLQISVLLLLLSGTGTAQDNPGTHYSDLVYDVSGSVVQVIVDRFGAPNRFQTSENSSLSRQVGNGSGVIVDSEGFIITNRHVVERSKNIRVLLPPPRDEVDETSSILRPDGNVKEAFLVGMDSETDIAVLKIYDGPYNALPFGDSQSLRAGEIVFAFGSPMGLENSVSMGIVSATARQLRDEDPMIYIQTDAPINPGNSGGPLINQKGEIVGINTLNLSQSGGSEGLGFAAPSHIVRSIYEQIIENGRVKRGIIGTYAQTVNPQLAQALDLASNHRVILGDVAPGSPADVAGLAAGDIILKLDGKTIENARQFNVNIYGKPIDSFVEIEIFRNGEMDTRRVKIVERSDRDMQLLALADPEDNFIDPLGVLAIGLKSDIRDMLPPLRKRGGVLIAASNGKTDVMGDPLRPGDIIYSVNGTDIFSFDEFYNIFDRLMPGDITVMQIQRGNRLMYVSHRMID